MILFLLAYLGGALTIVSPCILPVLPFVFARADRSFSHSGLPMLAGMALTFAVVSTIASFAGGWVVEANQYGRAAALVLLAFFGATLLFPQLSEQVTRPLVALGARLSQHRDNAAQTVFPSLVLGVATGLLWAPCAGPVLGLILTGAALQGASIRTTLLLLAYAAGAATSLALALLVGGRVFQAMKRSLGIGDWIRRGLGVAVLVAVAVIGLGIDTGLLTRVSLSNTASLEQGLLDRFHPHTTNQGPAMMMRAVSLPVATELPVEGTLPDLSGAVAWLNSPPLTAAGLKGKVVLVDFWTYSCINCLRTIPYVRAWAAKYQSQGLVVIGVHAPEFAFEKDLANVRKAVSDLDIKYPVAIDNNYAIWRGFGNEYWPALYFIDAEGRIRHHHFGEGDDDASERIIQQLLKETGKAIPSDHLVSVAASGAEAASDFNDVESPETYIGYARAENFVSPSGAIPDSDHLYDPGMPQLNQWGLAGDWTVGGERAVLDHANGGIVYRFHARDLHLVLGIPPNGRPVRFRVTIDGAAPGASHGADIDAAGQGIVTGERLYQLVRQAGPIMDRQFEIRFLDPGVEAYSFTFG